MSKLLDIKGYWNMYGIHNFNETGTWEGKLLLNDDGWFEGIVVDPNSEYTADRFIFGIYYPEKFIELFKFTPITISDPFVFHGIKNGDAYDGEFEVIELLGSTIVGVSSININEREYTEEEVEELKNKIQSYKESFDEVGKEFYDNSIAMKNTMRQAFLRQYEGRGFTDEEIEELKKEYEPVNERVQESTEKEIKRLVKDLFDDDELPF